MKKTVAAVIVLLSLGGVASGQNRPAASPLTTSASARASVKSARPSRGEPAKGDRAKSKASVDDVDRLLEIWDLAQGGSALENLRTRIVRGRIEMSDSNLTGSFENYLKKPRKAMIVANTPRGQILEVRDGNQRWLQTPWGGVVSAGYGDESLGRVASGKGGSKWKEFFSAASLKGRGYVDGREMIVLAATPHGRPPMLWHFDAGTGLLRKLEFANPAAAGGGDVRLLGVYFDRYATVDGVQVPSLFRQVYTQFTLTFRVTEVKHNVPIDDALFANPNGK
ncbi:MAG: hypothetical protein ABW208_15385 [Pyrinomonadaceae bacterium]